MTRYRGPLVAVLSAAAAVVLAAPATADGVQGGGANNLVVASNTAGGTTIRTGTQVANAFGPTVASTYLARATSTNCVGCRTVAVAIQELLFGDPPTFVPYNAAVAVNAACSGCDIFAYAHQHAWQTAPGAHLSPAGEQQVALLRQQISDTANAGLADEPLSIALDSLTDQLDAVIQTDLVKSGASPRDLGGQRDVQTAP
ncbi:MAG: hypothetical protein NVSMB13_15630 [Mycobacteriales bacterium]